MPDHTPEEKAKAKAAKGKKNLKGAAAIGKSAIPGQFGKSLMDAVNRKIKKATKKK